MATLLVLTLVFASAREAQSQILVVRSRGHIDVLATGLDITGTQNPDNQRVFRESLLHFGEGHELFDSASVTSYQVSPTIGALPFTSGAYLFADNAILSAGVDGTGNGIADFSPMGGGKASVSWSDTLTLRWSGPGEFPQLPSGDLVFHFVLEGGLAVAVDGAWGNWKRSQAEVIARFQTSLDERRAVGYRLFKDVGEDQQTILTTFETIASIRADRTVKYAYALDVSASANAGSATAAFTEGLTLESITFADGTTPESHGWELVFDSGLLSPNIEPVDDDGDEGPSDPTDPDDPMPIDLLIDLVDLVNDVDFINANNGLVSSLDAKLDNALDAFTAANADNRQDAVHKLEAFINAVEAHRGKKISEEEADYLTGSAAKIIDKTKN